MPKKPQRKPKPNASDFQAHKKRGVVGDNFSSASRKSSKSSEDTGNKPGVHLGFYFLKPSKISVSGEFIADDGIAHRRTMNVFDAGNQIAYFARFSSPVACILGVKFPSHRPDDRDPWISSVLYRLFNAAIFHAN